MTLIARLLKDSVPVYVGDLLISRDGQTRQPINIPLADDVNAKLPPGTGWSIAGTRQKLNILNEKVIIAWAGDYLQARHLARNIRNAVDAGAVSFNDISRLVQSVEEEDRNNLALIGTVLAPQQHGVHLEHFSYAANKSTIASAELVAAGSGADDLQRLLPQLMEGFPHPSHEPHSRQLWALQIGTAISSSIVGGETTTGANIMNRWGGGIEVATLVKGRFQKMGGILHTAWKAKELSSGEWELMLLPSLIKYDYFDDALVAKKINLSLKPDGTAQPCQQFCYISLPLLRGRREYNFDDVIRNFADFSHTTLSCVVLIEGRGLPAAHYMRVYHRRDGKTPFRVETLRDHFLISFENSLLKELGAVVTMPPRREQ